MEKINLCEGVVAQMMDTEAWGNVSGDFPFSEAQLEKYADKLDWKEVSGNTNIFWSVQMLEKFKRRIDWTALSRCLQEENVSAELLEKFKDNWNWEELSDNNCLTPELIDQFADYINWKALINNWSCCEKLATEEFIRKYSDRIPACDFKDSRLWREMVEKKEKEIKKQMPVLKLIHRGGRQAVTQRIDCTFSHSLTVGGGAFIILSNSLLASTARL